MKRVLRNLNFFLGVLLFIAALWVLHRELGQYHVRDIRRSLEGIPHSKIYACFALSCVSYLLLTGYDFLAMRYVRRRLRWAQVAFASFVAYVFSHNTGLSGLGGSLVRFRLYSVWGLSTVEIARVIVFGALTFWLGYLAVAGIVFLLGAPDISASFRLPTGLLTGAGLVFLLLLVGYLLWCSLRQRHIKVWGWQFSLPSSQIALGQVAISSLDWVVAGSVLYVLLPKATGLSFGSFLGIFLIAQLGGMVSHVPAGLGVFDGTVLLLLSPLLPATVVVGALLVYRVIYYVLPLGIASALLGIFEIARRTETLGRLASTLGRGVFEATPRVLALSIFVSGSILLFSGATPPIHGRMKWLEDFLPLPALEVSHFLGSLAGVGLLMLALAVQRRLDAAYALTVSLLSAGILFSLMKGLDYEEAVALAVMLGAFLPCRRFFYRKTVLFQERFSPGWIASIALVLLGSIGLGLFAYKDVEFTNELWWRFAWSGDAPRFLRATVGVTGVAVFFALARLLRPVPARPALPSSGDLEKARAIGESSRSTSANLALVGDKALFFNEQATAFIMFGVEGRSWVSLGDPVGPNDACTELVWRFFETADRNGGWTVFYEVGEKYRSLYLDLGLTLLKIGEQARVPLDTFSLEGGARKHLRRQHRRAAAAGYSFEVIPQGNLTPYLPQLRAVSDAWLAEKSSREKKFSVGFFREDYLKRFPVAVARSQGQTVAFGNIWTSAEHEELSVDLMRYLPYVSYNVMEYLLIELMLWGKQQGYRWFNLGMTPLAGLEKENIPFVWYRLGTWLYRHGEHFYNFQGLRQYKEKFDPVWEPSYLASPGGLALPRLVTNIATLISGGIKGLVAK